MVRLSDTAIDEIYATPKKVLHFWLQDEAPEPESVGWLGRILGKKEGGVQRCSVPRESNDETDLDKAWEAMDYLLSDGKKTEGASRFLTAGGAEIPEEVAYGPPRVFRSAEVKKIDAFLRGVTSEELRSRYDPEAMDREKIYPQIWTRDGAEGIDYIISFFEPLRVFVGDAARRGSGLMIIYT